jgi:hypothetical protein
LRSINIARLPDARCQGRKILPASSGGRRRLEAF